ncbi:MAG: TRAP transporter TatT component family protein [Desulfatibacillaceae bacterium]
MKAKKAVCVAALLAVAVMFGGCAETAINVAGEPVLQMLVKEISDTKSAHLARDGMAGQLLLVTALCEMSPHNRDLLATTAFLYSAEGMFKEDTDLVMAKEMYKIGEDYGMRALKTNKKFRQALEEGKKIPEVVDLLDEDYVPALTWAGMNLGLGIVHNMDNPMALMAMPDAIALIKRSVELDPDYYYGTGTLFLGAYYALTPAFLGLGGGPENSAKKFDEARALTDGKFLLVDVFEARYLATFVDDQERFEALLNHVLEADASQLPGGRLLNELAKLKAELFLEQKNQFF